VFDVGTNTFVGTNMRRRDFLLGIGGIVAAEALCSHASCATARGCRLAAGESDAPEYLTESGYGSIFDGACHSYADELNSMFGVRPALRFYDDTGSKNAFADPDARYSEGPDGTVVLGIALLG
jgi:hypothetical protein